VTSVAGRLGVSTKSLYDWVKRYGDTPDTTGNSAAQSEIKRLKAELRRVTEERDILKKATVYFAKDHGFMLGSRPDYHDKLSEGGV